MRGTERHRGGQQDAARQAGDGTGQGYFAAIEKKCGTPGQTALDGKAIGTTASSDLMRAQISSHIETAACRGDDVISRGYHGAADLPATMTARASQGAAPLATYFACLLP